MLLLTETMVNRLKGRNVDKVLARYRNSIAKRTGLTFPRFAPEATHTAQILCVLETPGRSGAERSGYCSVDNPDPTARRMKRILEEIELAREDIVFWNFYAAYEIDAAKKVEWATELERLIGLLPNLKVVITFGDRAWRGLRDVELRIGISLIGAPHPSNRSCNSIRDAEDRIGKALKRAKLLTGWLLLPHMSNVEERPKR